MRGGFLVGAGYALRGARLLKQPGLRRFVLGPLVINVLVFSAALAGFGTLFEQTLATLFPDLPEWLAWLAWLLFGALLLIMLFFTFSLVANVIASPFNGLLAEAVERHLAAPDAPLPFDWRSLFAEAGRAFAAALRKLAYIGLRALPLLLLSVIPGLNLLAPALWLLFGAWMLAIEYLDCPLGNHGEVFPAAVARLREARAMALGFGVVLSLMTMVPVLNFLAMPVGVAGATVMYVERFRR